WNNDRDRIPANRRAHGAHSFGTSDSTGDLSVAECLPERDRRQCLPDLLLKLGALEVALQRKFVPLAREVFIQLALRFEKHRMVFLFRERAEPYAFRIIVLPQD